MSLRVWLPLTKDLRNQGLDDIAVTNSGATFDSVGKLGGCYSFDGTDDAITVGNLSTLVTDKFSFACWFYHDDTWSSKNYETIFGGPSGFELETKSGSTNSPVIRAYSWGQGTFTYELNKWNHLVMTRTTSETKFYLNGELKLTGTAGTIPSGNYFIGSWSSTTGQNFKGKVNDIRIYDHCLSPMEVKELAKGLVLHYPLSDRFLEATTNLNTKINMDTKTNSIWGGHSTTSTVYDCTNEPVPFNSGNKIEITYPVDGNTGGGTSVSLGVGIPVSPSTTYTLSTYLKASDNFNYWTANFLYYYGDTAGYGIFNINNKEYIADGWYRIWGTLTTGSNQTSLMPYFYSYPSENRTYYIGGWQLEQKNHMTPFVSPGSSRNNSTTEYDCSGFCNNGTISGALTISNDTPKYVVSTQFTGTQFITAGSPTSEGATLALWAKTTSTSGAALVIDYKSKLGFGFWSGVIIPSCNSNIKTTYSTTNYIVNQWNHIVVVRDSSSTLQLYINGVLQTNIASVRDYWSGGVIDGLSIAARPNGSSPVSCQVSDVRIYATALSADDVKSLYQNSAYIDSSGNVYGTIHES